MSCNNLSATQLAIIAAVIMVIADIIGLIAAIAAFDEEQKSSADAQSDIETKIKCLQDQLHARPASSKRT